MSQTSGVSCCTYKRQIFDPYVTHLKVLVQVDLDKTGVQQISKQPLCLSFEFSLPFWPVEIIVLML